MATPEITTDSADRVIAPWRAPEAELPQAGTRRRALCGAGARGDAAAGSDVDLVAEFDPAARMDLIRLMGLERRLAEILHRRVDLPPEPVRKARLRANTEHIESYLVGMGRDAFERDQRTRDAVERCLERVCEAVRRLGFADASGHAPGLSGSSNPSRPCLAAGCRAEAGRDEAGRAGSVLGRLCR